MTLKEEFTTFVNTGAFTDLNYNLTIEKTADWWLSKFSEMIDEERTDCHHDSSAHCKEEDCGADSWNTALDSLQAKIKS